VVEIVAERGAADLELPFVGPEAGLKPDARRKEENVVQVQRARFDDFFFRNDDVTARPPRQVPFHVFNVFDSLPFHRHRFHDDLWVLFINRVRPHDQRRPYASE
jgi:hypothetical protein